MSMSGTTITRPVLTAESLLQDYLRAARQMTGYLGAQDEEGFRVHLAEANRLYPAIWDQLDQARAAATSAGRDTSAYDALRAQRDKLDVGVAYDATEWKVDVLDSLAEMGLVTSKRVSVELNLHGLVLARKGIDAHRAAAPDLDWAGEKRALDALGDVNVRSGGAAAWTIKLLVAAFLIGFAYFFIWVFSH